MNGARCRKSIIRLYCALARQRNRRPSERPRATQESANAFQPPHTYLPFRPPPTTSASCWQVMVAEGCENHLLRKQDKLRAQWLERRLLAHQTTNNCSTKRAATHRNFKTHPFPIEAKNIGEKEPKHTHAQADVPKPADKTNETTQTRAHTTECAHTPAHPRGR